LAVEVGSSAASGATARRTRRGGCAGARSAFRTMSSSRRLEVHRAGFTGGSKKAGAPRSGELAWQAQAEVHQPLAHSLASSGGRGLKKERRSSTSRGIGVGDLSPAGNRGRTGVGGLVPAQAAGTVRLRLRQQRIGDLTPSNDAVVEETPSRPDGPGVRCRGSSAPIGTTVCLRRAALMRGATMPAGPVGWRTWNMNGRRRVPGLPTVRESTPADGLRRLDGNGKEANRIVRRAGCVAG